MADVAHRPDLDESTGAIVGHPFPTQVVRSQDQRLTPNVKAICLGRDSWRDSTKTHEVWSRLGSARLANRTQGSVPQNGTSLTVAKVQSSVVLVAKCSGGLRIRGRSNTGMAFPRLHS